MTTASARARALGSARFQARWVRAATCTPRSRRTWQTDSTARFLVRCSSMNATINADGGRDPRQAVDTYRAFSSFLLGQLRLEPAVRGAEIGPAEEPLDEDDPPAPEGDVQSGHLEHAPEVARLCGLLSEDRVDKEFEVSLESLLERLDRAYSQ
ncbi:MAG: hypothetical protein IJO71_00365 [Microbacterium sp.]|uniref:hypothetical protein n=1 Tax=Microbacterium TaxID=33882 RepID=UPI0022E00DC6|nr:MULTISPECIES: hypothetical protein [Microbacterium]MBQ9915639.1 hypothetical protein [Microbacterium sp.]MDI9893047.1 hypothetical protein [Microbacterium sp. IEGM 1404]